MDLLGKVEASKRRRNAIYYAAAAGVFFLLMIVVVVSSEYDDLGLGTINNTFVTWLNLFWLVSSTIVMVKSCRLRTPKGGITHWKHVGLFTLILLESVILIWVAVYLFPGIRLFSVFIMATIPSLIWFPIWTGVSAIRGARNPDRLIPMRVKVKATSTNEPSPDDEAPNRDSKLRRLAGWLGMDPGTAETPFTKKVDILNCFCEDYYGTDVYVKFLEHENLPDDYVLESLGIPMALMLWRDMVTVDGLTEYGKSVLEDTWISLCETLQVDPYGEYDFLETMMMRKDE